MSPFPSLTLKAVTTEHLDYVARLSPLLGSATQHPEAVPHPLRPSFHFPVCGLCTGLVHILI